jgi:hypothetical protein
VRARAIAVVTDVTRRYDIDGVHIDDYFYPYPPAGQKCDFPDDATYAEHGRGQERDAWRRSNIDTFVRDLYRAVKSAKPHVKFGISPFGIWRPGHPAGVEAQLDAYAHIYADSRRWLREGWCDYFSPQLYWRIAPPDQSFTALLEWWDGENRQRRHLWPGLATSRVGSNEDPGRPAAEIVSQIEAARRLAREPAPGHLHWNSSALRSNRDGVADLVRTRSYNGGAKALVPASPWLGRLRLPAPELRSTADGTYAWSAAAPGTRWWAVQTRDSSGRWTLSAVLPADRVMATLSEPVAGFSIRPVDLFGNASAPAVLERR